MREQISGVRVIRAFVKEAHERERFDGANPDLHGRGRPRGPPDGVDVPDRDAGHERLLRRRDVVRVAT